MDELPCMQQQFDWLGSSNEMQLIYGVYGVDPYHWAWTPMAQKPFSDDIRSQILPKLSDEDSIESLVRDLRKLFKV